MSLIAFGVSYTFANSIEDLRFEDWLFTGYFSWIQNNQSDVNFAYKWNNFWWVFFFKWMEMLSTGEVLSLSWISKTCTQRVLWLYYNSQRWNRLRPLDEQSLSWLKLLDPGYNGVSVTWWFFIWCSWNSQNVYGNISHTHWNINFELIAWVEYNFGSNTYINIYSGSLNFSSLKATWYIYDNYWWIAKVLLTWSTLAPTPICWNNIVEIWEVCDSWLYNWQVWYCNSSCSLIIQSQWWGWWWTRLIRDNCTYSSTSKNIPWANEDWLDNSPSYYDRTCLPDDEGDLEVWICSVRGSSYSQELNSAYQYNYHLWTTTVCPWSKAKLDKYILRKELAKMISVYATKVVWLDPISGKKWCNNYKDISKETKEMQKYMKMACELELMWLHSDGKTPKVNFDPNDFLTRAEFWTVFSRLIYWNKYNWNKIRYYDHLRALKKDEIMTQISAPFMKELRWFVMIVLRRADRDGIIDNLVK